MDPKAVATRETHTHTWVFTDTENKNTLAMKVTFWWAMTSKGRGRFWFHGG